MVAQAFRLGSATRNVDGGITTASIIWPDGAAGSFTTDSASTNFPSAVDAFDVTYVPTAGTSRTATQCERCLIFIAGASAAHSFDQP